MDKPSFPIAVVMEKVATGNRWQPEAWHVAGVLPDEPGGLRLLIDRPGLMQRVHPGFRLVIHQDEAEGYFLNVTSPDPRVFVMWREPADEAGEALPHSVTLSYNEGARWMDAQEKVESVAIPEDVYAALVAWVEANYRPPEKKERIRPRSFESKEGRYKRGLT